MYVEEINKIRLVLGWGVYVGDVCREQKIFLLPYCKSFSFRLLVLHEMLVARAPSTPTSKVAAPLFRGSVVCASFHSGPPTSTSKPPLLLLLFNSSQCTAYGCSCLYVSDGFIDARPRSRTGQRKKLSLLFSHSLRVVASFVIAGLELTLPAGKLRIHRRSGNDGPETVKSFAISNQESYGTLADTTGSLSWPLGKR